MSEKQVSKKQVSKKQVSKKQVSFEEIEQRLSSVETKVGAIGRILSKVKAFIEKMYKFDIDGDGNIGKMAIALICVGLLIPMVSFAEIGSESGDKANWRNAAIRANGDIDTEGGIVAAGSMAIAGDVTVDGAVVDKGETLQTVTNGQSIVFAPGVNIITPSGLASGYTNSCTLDPATPEGNYTVIVYVDATNLLFIQDAQGAYLATDFIGDAKDTLSFRGTSAGLYFETSRSSN